MRLPSDPDFHDSLMSECHDARRAEVESRERKLHAVRRQAETAAEEARAAAAAAGRGRDAAEAQAEERRVQVAVLMDTVEALQAGSGSERDQRVVTLTAQLAAARAVEGSLERRATELLAEVEAAQGAAARAGEAASRATEDLAAARAEAAEVARARAAARRVEEEVAGLARKLDVAQESLRRSQADLKGTQEAMETAR